VEHDNTRTNFDFRHCFSKKIYSGKKQRSAVMTFERCFFSPRIPQPRRNPIDRHHHRVAASGQRIMKTDERMRAVYPFIRSFIRCPRPSPRIPQPRRNPIDRHHHRVAASGQRIMKADERMRVSYPFIRFSIRWQSLSSSRRGQRSTDNKNG
jgi:hypothetical protein